MKRTSPVSGLFTGYFKTDIKTVVLISCFCCGVFCGALLYRFDIGISCNYAASVTDNLLFGMLDSGFAGIFLSYLLYMLTAYFFSVLLGLFVPGELLSFAYLVFEGVRVGAVYADIYSGYGMKGALFAFSVLFVPTVAFVYSMAFAFRGTVNFSLMLLMQFLGKKCDNLFTEYKAFLLRSLLFAALITAAALAGASMYKCFAGVFNFA